MLLWLMGEQSLRLSANPCLSLSCLTLLSISPSAALVPRRESSSQHAPRKAQAFSFLHSITSLPVSQSASHLQRFVPISHHCYVNSDLFVLVCLSLLSCLSHFSWLISVMISIINIHYFYMSSIPFLFR